MIVDPKPLGYYVEQLNAGKRFAFVRYGNGEWDCILGLYHTTRSGSQRFTPDLRAALTATLTTKRGPAYHVASQSVPYLTNSGIMQQADNWLHTNSIKLDWVDGEVFTRASMHKRLYPFVEAIQKQRVVVVGPQWLIKLPFARTFIPVSSRDCWTDHEKTLNQLRAFDNAVILFSAGPTAKVLIHQLWGEKHNNWLIDCGSVWDPYCGVRSRRYHKRINADVIRKNLRGK